LTLHHQIEELTKSQSYITCLLLVHPEIEVLNTTTDEILNTYEFPYLDIGMTLSEALLPIKLGERSRFTSQWLERELSDISSELNLITNIYLLFEPSLQLDPLRIFRGQGRRFKLVVMWPGEFDGSNLSYAVPQHDHYRTWQNPDLQIYHLK
jgi:hypothetical protein